MKTIILGGKKRRVSQCQNPRGVLGRVVLWNMNSRHSKVTDWGLAQIVIEKHYTILDVGCGGGRTLAKLATAATQGKIYGIDYSEESVALSKRTNARLIDTGRVEVRHGSVSQLPFPDATFDLVTAVETHFWWPNLTEDVREISRVVKPGGKLVIIAEVYKGANTRMAQLVERYAPHTGIVLLDVQQHRELLANAGFSQIEIVEQGERGWICAMGQKN